MTWLLALSLGLITASSQAPVRIALSTTVAAVQVHGTVTVGEHTFDSPCCLPSPAGVRLGDGEPAAQVLLSGPAGRLQVELRTRADRKSQPQTYRGTLRLFAGPRGLLVVNELPLDDYLRGVVPLEIGGRGPAAALRAQAIVARSFALARRRVAQDSRYDLAVASTQAYRGQGGETAAANEAVEATTGQVLQVDGRVLEAVYGDCCGGVTATAQEVWRAEIPGLLSGFDLAPRQPVTLDEHGLRDFLAAPRGWCEHAPLHRWQRTWTWSEFTAEIGRRVKALAPRSAVGTVTDVQVVARGASGRSAAVRVAGDGGEATVRGETIRSLLTRRGANLPSNLFVLERDGDTVTARGGGWGHGVGLCQAGALAMGAAGWTVEAILKHYYPGATLGTIDGTELQR